jgi:hypothetical protein
MVRQRTAELELGNGKRPSRAGSPNSTALTIVAGGKSADFFLPVEQIA